MLLLLVQIEQADEGVWAAALTCLEYFVCDRMACILQYRLPSSSDDSVAGKPTLVLQQIELMGGIEICDEYTRAKTPGAKRNLFAVMFDLVLSELEEGAVRSQKQFPGSEKMRAVATSLCLAEASECYDLAFKQGLPGVGKTLFKSIRTVMYRDVMSGRLDAQLLEDVVGGLDKLAGLEKLACTYAHPQEEYMELVSVTLASKGLDTSKTGETLKIFQIQLR
ncbi:hypothetical protein R1sor_013575 [Riccia sorocarpa]|uniref:Uncharacterized protein n=1 Tax=Riccia sorocarpa TaxID=122646 RepID=A0ABD3HB22_9MARC